MANRGHLRTILAILVRLVPHFSALCLRFIVSALPHGDGTILASACLQDKEVLIWDLRTSSLQRSLDSPVLTYAVAFSADGKTLACGGADKLIRRWDLSSGTQLASFKGALEIYCLAYFPDGKLLAAGGTRREITGQAEDLLQLWDAPSGRVERRIAATASFRVNALAFSPDGR